MSYFTLCACFCEYAVLPQTNLANIAIAQNKVLITVTFTVKEGMR